VNNFLEYRENFIMNDFEPLFRSQIPERTSEAFSRQWYSRGDWKLDEPTLMMKVDRTKKKMGDLIRRVTVLGSENVIPEWLYSSLFEYIQWIMSSTGVHKISMDMVRDSSSGFDAIRYVDKTEKIYPKIPNPTREDWDAVVFGDRIRIGEAARNRMDYCVVMPSMETIQWLNEVNVYCKGMDEWAKRTYLQTQTKLAESKQFLKRIHAKLAVNGNVYMTEEEARRGLGL